MLRRLASLAACVLFLAAVPTGSLYVTTLPAGADVWIDGTYVGRSPLVLDALGTGRHSVGLAMAGWTPQQVDINVAPGQTTLSSTKLDRAAGKLQGAGSIAIHGVPAGTVYLDGMPVRAGKDGAFAASAGTHELAVHTPKGRLTRSVTVWPQTRTDVVLAPDERRRLLREVVGRRLERAQRREVEPELRVDDLIDVFGRREVLQAHAAQVAHRDGRAAREVHETMVRGEQEPASVHEGPRRWWRVARLSRHLGGPRCFSRKAKVPTPWISCGPGKYSISVCSGIFSREYSRRTLAYS